MSAGRDGAITSGCCAEADRLIILAGPAVDSGWFLMVPAPRIVWVPGDSGPVARLEPDTTATPLLRVRYCPFCGAELGGAG